MTKTQQRQIFLGAAILGVALFAFILMSFWNLSGSKEAKLGSPDFTQKLEQGKPWPAGSSLPLPGRDGSWTLVVFWADWCEPCHAEIPTLQELSDTWNGPMLDVVLVNEDDDGSEFMNSAQKYITDNNITLKSIWDKNKKIKEAVGVDKIPFHVLVDQKGAIVWQQPGVFDWRSESTKLGLMRLQESLQEKIETLEDESQQTDKDVHIQNQESNPSPQ